MHTVNGEESEIVKCSIARWGMVEWIEHPLLMLEVRGSNPGHSISKNTTSLPETKWLFGANFGAYPVLRVTPVYRPKKLDLWTNIEYLLILYMKLTKF